MEKFKLLYVYILKCVDGTYYTGITNNLERRFIEHSEGSSKDCYTFSRGPLKLVYYEMFSDYNLAIQWEKRIKKWSQKKKEALIESDWINLQHASVCKNESSHKEKK